MLNYAIYHPNTLNVTPLGDLTLKEVMLIADVLDDVGGNETLCFTADTEPTCIICKGLINEGENVTHTGNGQTVHYRCVIRVYELLEQANLVFASLHNDHVIEDEIVLPYMSTEGADLPFRLMPPF